jgi:hypothetical protein
MSTLDEKLRALHDGDADMVNSYPSCREYACLCMDALRTAAALALEECAEMPFAEYQKLKAEGRVMEEEQDGVHYAGTLVRELARRCRDGNA